MLEINELIKSTMKKEIFNGSELENKSARLVLSEIKTKLVDFRESINAETQNKILKKIASDRSKSIEIYKEAQREDLLEKEVAEYEVCKKLLDDLSNYLPKMMTEEEIKEKIESIISSNDKANIGIIMKEFKELNADRALVSKIAKEML